MPGRTPIPRLTPTTNGFGGFTVNPSIPYPGGRVLTSDVEDAANTMNFGGTPSQRFNPAPSPTPNPTPSATPPFNPDPSGAGLVSPEIRDFYNQTYDRRFWHNDPNSGDPTGSGEVPTVTLNTLLGADPNYFYDHVAIRPHTPYAESTPGRRESKNIIDEQTGGPHTTNVWDLDYTSQLDYVPDPGSETYTWDTNYDDSPTYAGPGGKPPGITTDPNDDWTGTNPHIDPTVELYTGAPGSGGVPVWWDTNNRGSNRIGPQPWWIGFNPSLGQNFTSTFTGPGFDNYAPGGEIYVGGDLYGKTPSSSNPILIDTNEGVSDQKLINDQRASLGLPPQIPTAVASETTGLTIVGYDQNNHQPIYRDSAGKLYVNPGTGVASGGMPQDVRFADNGVTGNYVADKTTDAFVAAGGYAGSPNRQVAPDSGRDTFGGSTGRLDPETGIINKVASTGPGIAFSMSQKSGAPTLRPGDPKSAAAYNAWLMQQPEYKAFMQRMLGAGARPSFQTGGGGPTPRSGSGGG